MSKIIMVVDDNKSNLATQKGYLESKYDVVLATSGESALKRLKKVIPDLILLDNIMPGMSGIQVLDELQKDEKLRQIPVIILTGMDDSKTEKACFVHGAADFITKPFSPDVLLERIRKTLEYWELRYKLELQVYSKTKEAESVVLQSIMAIANTIDAKDAYTKGHSERVAEYAAVIAKELDWSEDEVKFLYNIALLHDIGKIGIPDSILNKPGRLSDYEFSIIKKHPVMGGEILKDIPSMQDAYVAARYHHERYDGKGYPEGLAGEEIPIYARVIAVADAYDAMTSNRVYRKKLSNKVVISELKKGMGTQFDPKIAKVFVDILSQNDDEPMETVEEKPARIPGVLDRQKMIDEFETTHDSISGLYHKEQGLELISQIPTREDYTFCLIDIGNFPQLNKAYGRIQGDYVLEMAARIINHNLKGDDFAYRSCGGTFGICLRNQSEPEEIQAFAEQVIQEFDEKKKEIRVMEFCDLYIGISRTICNGKNFEKIYNHADRALYFAKNRNDKHYAFYQEKTKEIQGFDEKGIERLVSCLFSEEKRTDYAVTGNKRLIRLLDEAAAFIQASEKTCTMILFELISIKENTEEYRSLKDSINNLELAIIETLKSEDKGMNFSSSQYLVILPETKDRNIDKFIKRTFEQYYRMDSSTRFELEYKYLQGIKG